MAAVQHLLASLTWPDVGLILALLALVLYSRPLGRLLDHIKFLRVGRGELVASSNPQPDLPTLKPDAAASVAERPNDAFIEAGKAAVKTHIDQTAGPDPARREEALLHLTASMFIAWNFERI